ncbi:hypothetical protein I0C86_17805 [Plantactinospora sp. S1510]|uniref:Uncharacterized protein n=1 Tax=Plantactinospora alkalitolerans TaxID=2789879 RepID=A0ABS0GX97_9ACTN|nr:hypothetical protein [Plantactinospora alkalitolerans]MBF9130800.1 hypothetical protein [Plantactinospora alkalitolerans]
MEKVLFNFLINVPQAATIWLVLIGLALAGGIALVVRPRRDETGRDVTGRQAGAGYDVATRDAEGRRERLAVRAAELNRYAEEVTVAAERSAVTARRRRDEWLAAQEEAETAWQAYEAADAAARRVAAAAVLPEPRTPRTPAEYADRERYLHRAAMAAATRQELSVLQLSDALANRNGWDPRRHPAEQEIVLRRAARDSLLAAHAAAAERERAAWRDAEVAAAAARSLREEAFAAASRTAQVRRWLPPTPSPDGSPRGSSGEAVRRPHPVRRWRAARAG